MAFSKSTRIIILLAIDTAFFLLELIVGYTVHSLALVADAFHMLNDVLSLCVGLWAVRVAHSRASSKVYTYGWQRAETLGALLNGVFLVALCVSIFLEAIQRFVEPQEVTQPKLVLIVGCLGLASNILGLFLFHDHGHSHGPGGHSHGHGDGVKDAEEGNMHDSHADHRERQAADESGNIADVLPESRIGGWPRTKTGPLEGSDSTVVEDGSPLRKRSSSTARFSKPRKHSRSGSRAYSGLDDIHINPSSFRKSIIDASRFGGDPEENVDAESAVEGGEGEDEFRTHADTPPSEPLLNQDASQNYGAVEGSSLDHTNHRHRQPKEAGKGHGHSHSDLNMRGVFLHVMGDALGNIGVIATALFIWLTDYSWRFYMDPLVSLIITAIILASAIPLCKAASRILLQAVPAGISIDDIKGDIEALPGILSCHHLHVWQLSDTKLVASLHVRVVMDFKNEDAARYMQLARAIRRCFHEYGIHSCAIQPEFCLDQQHDHTPASLGGESHGDRDSDQHNGASRAASKSGSVCEPDQCLLECDDDYDGQQGSCCGPPPADAKDATQGHDHGHGHDHAH